MPNIKYTEGQIKKLLDGIYDGSITEFDLPEDYYNAVVEYLKKGLYKGFGMTLTTAEGKDLELLKELRENVYMFSAAKTYQEVKEISSWLVDDEGNLRSRSDFNALGRATYDTWNDDYGNTEYNTAVGQGMMAVKWNEIEKNKEVLPILTYSAIGDACDICAPLDGLTAKVDDPIWDTIMPLNHYNCMCTVLQQEDGDLTPKEEVDDIFEGVNEKMDDVFKNNVGKTGEVFPKDHPYFDAPEKLGKNNFGLPIPEEDE